MSDMDPNVFGDVFGPSSSSVMNTMPSHRGHVQPTHSNSYQSQQMYYSSGFDPRARSFVENQNPLFQIVRGQIASKWVPISHWIMPALICISFRPPAHQPNLYWSDTRA
jgi:hypothetical protein